MINREPLPDYIISDDADKYLAANPDALKEPPPPGLQQTIGGDFSPAEIEAAFNIFLPR